jgi:hypothetical protein
VNKRKLKVTFDLSNSDIQNSAVQDDTGTTGAPFIENTIVIDESQFITVSIQKTFDAIQNSAQIAIINLRSDLRAALLSYMTAFRYRTIAGQTADPLAAADAVVNYVGVTVEAGYEAPASNLAPYGYSPSGNTQTFSSVVFVGEVALCEPIGAPPNQGIHITAYTHQVDRTTAVVTEPPQDPTFRDLVAWAADLMGIEYSCDTKFDDKKQPNGLASVPSRGALIHAIAQLHAGEIAAYIDDHLFVVRDIDKAINPNEIVQVYDFINMPLWTEWGCKFTTFFSPNLQLMHFARLNSVMNPSLNTTDWIIHTMEYQLSSREEQFYITAQGSPAAAEATGMVLPVKTIGKAQ